MSKSEIPQLGTTTFFFQNPERQRKLHGEKRGKRIKTKKKKKQAVKNASNGHLINFSQGRSASLLNETDANSTGFEHASVR